MNPEKSGYVVVLYKEFVVINSKSILLIVKESKT